MTVSAVHAAIRPEAARLQRKRARRQSFSFTWSAEVKSLHLPIIGSTAIIKYAEASKDAEFLVATELGVFLRAEKALDKFMQWKYADLPKYEKVTLDKLIEALELKRENEVLLSEQEIRFQTHMRR